jgi:hypothetical protein
VIRGREEGGRGSGLGKRREDRRRKERGMGRVGRGRREGKIEK